VADNVIARTPSAKYTIARFVIHTASNAPIDAWILVSLGELKKHFCGGFPAPLDSTASGTPGSEREQIHSLREPPTSAHQQPTMLTRSLLRSSLPLLSHHHRLSLHLTHPRLHHLTNPIPHRRPASQTTRPPNPRIDAKIEELQDLYATAKDEFEIASEETDKKTVYAADDRAAAKEELEKLKEAFERAVGEEGGEEVRTRVGGRVRELERAVEAMEERAMED